MDKSKFPYKFTLNKVYPVFSERYNMTGVGMMIMTTDDNDNTVEVTDEYFVPANTALEYENEMDAGKRGNNDLLNWINLLNSVVCLLPDVSRENAETLIRARNKVIK